MSKNFTTYLSTIYVLFFFNLSIAQDFDYSKANTEIIGRGQVEWTDGMTSISNCLIAGKTENPENFEMVFLTRAPKGAEEVQLWSGFGYQDRENRYALGLRGGNSNDLYLCRYESHGKNEMLALEPLDFTPEPENWYAIRVVFWDGNIRIYLNDEKAPRIVTTDSEYLKGGSSVLGGGWLPANFKDLKIRALTDTDISFFAKDTVSYRDTKKLSLQQKNEIRIEQRNNYVPQNIEKLSKTRTEISLNGKWLFMPESNIIDVDNAINKNSSDKDWHVMNVPEFWNPVTNWLHLGASKLPHPGSGVSDNYWQKEYERCENYTFDYKRVNGAYYRHWVVLPDEIKGKVASLHFEAIAKVAKVWVNGSYAGEHIGMFEDFDLDVSHLLVKGENLIVVKVNNKLAEKTTDADEIAEVAVTVEVTNDMLNSLPRGMFDKDEGGIWQPVKLIFTEKTVIDDVFVMTQTNGANIDITLSNLDKNRRRLRLEGEILDLKNNDILYTFSKEDIQYQKGMNTPITISTGELSPKLWSPENPSLYKLNVTLFAGKREIDAYHTEIGFRTFETKGNKFYLNGNPYWLRGANHPPTGLAPNDSVLANKFMKSMHENNQMVTRTHGTTITKEWAKAANRQGVGISVEGSWPWVMLGSGMPSKTLLKLWEKELLAMVKTYRNDPSILTWTISNESYFTNYYVEDDQRMEKWKIFSDVIKEVRKLDPTRPISATSGYIRHTPDYVDVLEPAGIDDGDFDDSHNSYFGWYNPDQFYLYDGNWTKELYLSTGATPNRPFISQELSTGYPNNDTGHPTRKYLFEHYTAQSWVGDWAYEDHDPSFFLKRHAQLTKEIGETVRRTSPMGAGVLHFANICWYKNVFESERMEAFPVVEKMKNALQPILISAELFGRNFYAGSTFSPRVCIVNDGINGESLNKGELKWEVVSEGKILSSGMMKTGEVPHYERLWNKITIDFPKDLPTEKTNCILKFSLSINGDVVSENKYDILIASKNWVVPATTMTKKIQLFDAAGTAKKFFGELGIQVDEIQNLKTIVADLLIVSDLDIVAKTPEHLDNVLDFARIGGNVLLLHPGKHILEFLPDEVDTINEESGRIVNMHIPESPVFNSIEPLELSWWQPSAERYPTVSRRTYVLYNNSKIKELCTYLKPHNYLSNKEEQLKALGGTPLIEYEIGEGTLIASELELFSGTTDPIAARVLSNLVHMLSGQDLN